MLLPELESPSTPSSDLHGRRLLSSGRVAGCVGAADRGLSQSPRCVNNRFPHRLPQSQPSSGFPCLRVCLVLGCGLFSLNNKSRICVVHRVSHGSQGNSEITRASPRETDASPQAPAGQAGGTLPLRPPAPPELVHGQHRPIARDGWIPVKLAQSSREGPLGRRVTDVCLRGPTVPHTFNSDVLLF